MEKATSCLLGNPIALAVCRHLWIQKTGLSGRALAKAISRSPQGIHNVLRILVEYGLVSCKKIGQSHAYRINEKHFLLAEGLFPLWEKIFAWKFHLGNYFMKALKKKPVSIILFGSFAHDQQKEDSDIDLLFLYEKTHFLDGIIESIQELSESVYQRFSVRPSCKVTTVAQFKSESKKKEGFMRNIFREGKVLAGKDLSEL